MRYFLWLIRVFALAAVLLSLPLMPRVVLQVTGVNTDGWFYQVVLWGWFLALTFYVLSLLRRRLGRPEYAGGFLLGTSRSWTLLYHPQLRGILDAAEIQRLVESTIRDFDAIFARAGRPPRGLSVVPGLPSDAFEVYLFSTVDDARTVCRWPNVVGLAPLQAPAVAIPFTGLPLPDVVRNQLARLYISRPWNQATPPLLSEGLPAWLQENYLGEKIDEIAARCVREGKGQLRPLLGKKSFRALAQDQQVYALAGSFNGFLLRRFGKDAYLRFFDAMYNGWRFDAKFRAHFRFSLEDAENEWQDALLSEQVFEATAETPHAISSV
jgi:hypothetical protein